MRIRINRFKLVAAAGIFTIATVGAGGAYASGAFTASAPTSPTNYTVYLGGGHNGDDFTNISYTPDTLNVFVGDKVTFVNADSIEPHTVTFGPLGMLTNIANQLINPEPNKNGPPTLALSPKAVEPTARDTYDGSGYVNSGILSSQYKGVTRNSWSVTFTKPGIYQYYCLVHFPFMVGTIIVNPRPSASGTYNVQMGYSGNGAEDYTTEADTFFPEDLTVHAGNTVIWQGGGHTVTFGTQAQVAKLQTQFVLRSGTAGSYKYQVNPQIAFPSANCGTSSACDYTGGFLNSGIIGGLGGGSSGGSFAVTFTKPGTYYYGCLVHKGMDGQITVLPATSKSA